MEGYVAGGWAAAAVGICLYGWWVLRRGRVLSRSLPPPEHGQDPSGGADQAPPGGGRGWR
ncbi:MAG: hypothetical protein ACRDY0_11420 [Acidimicrobiales bacterium]